VDFVSELNSLIYAITNAMESSSSVAEEIEPFEDTDSLLDHDRPRAKTRRGYLSSVLTILNHVTLMLNIILAAYTSVHWQPQVESDVRIDSYGLSMLIVIALPPNFPQTFPAQLSN